MPIGIQKPSITDRIRALFGIRGRFIAQVDETVVPVVVQDSLEAAPWRGIEKIAFHDVRFITDAFQNAKQGAVGIGIASTPPASGFAQANRDRGDVAVITHIVAEPLTVNAAGTPPPDLNTLEAGDGFGVYVASAGDWENGTEPVSSANQLVIRTDRAIGAVDAEPYRPRLLVRTDYRAQNLTGLQAQLFQTNSTASFKTGGVEFPVGSFEDNILKSPVTVGSGQVLIVIPILTTGRGMAWRLNIAGFYYPGFNELLGR